MQPESVVSRSCTKKGRRRQPELPHARSSTSTIIISSSITMNNTIITTIKMNITVIITVISVSLTILMTGAKQMRKEKWFEVTWKKLQSRLLKRLKVTDPKRYIAPNITLLYYSSLHFLFHYSNMTPIYTLSYASLNLNTPSLYPENLPQTPNPDMQVSKGRPWRSRSKGQKTWNIPGIINPKP